MVSLKIRKIIFVYARMANGSSTTRLNVVQSIILSVIYLSGLLLNCMNFKSFYWRQWRILRSHFLLQRPIRWPDCTNLVEKLWSNRYFWCSEFRSKNMLFHSIFSNLKKMNEISIFPTSSGWISFIVLRISIIDTIRIGNYVDFVKSF